MVQDGSSPCRDVVSVLTCLVVVLILTIVVVLSCFILECHPRRATPLANRRCRHGHRRQNYCKRSKEFSDLALPCRHCGCSCASVGRSRGMEGASRNVTLNWPSSSTSYECRYRIPYSSRGSTSASGTSSDSVYWSSFHSTMAKVYILSVFIISRVKCTNLD